MNVDENGQIERSLRRLAEDIGISLQETRSALSWCVANTIVNTVSNTRITQITICNYDSYAVLEKTSNTVNNTVANTPKETENTKEKDVSLLPPAPPLTHPEKENTKEKEKTAPKKRTAKKDPAVASIHGILHQEFIRTFGEFYQMRCGGEEYSWEKKDFPAIGRLVDNIIKSRKDKGLDATDPIQVVDAFKYFLNSIEDTWILEHLSVTIISSKYNELISQIYNKYNNNGQRISRAKQEQLLREQESRTEAAKALRTNLQPSVKTRRKLSLD